MIGIRHIERILPWRCAPCWQALRNGVLGTAALLLWGCAVLGPKFEKPSLAVSDIRMLEGNLFSQTFLVTLRIQNPNDQALPVKGLWADLKVGGEPFASGVTSRAFTVPALGESEFELRVNANLAVGVLKLLSSSQDRHSAINYELDGKVSVDLPFMRSIPFHENGVYSLSGSRSAETL